MAIFLGASLLANYQVRQVVLKVFNEDNQYRLVTLDFSLAVVQVQQWLTRISATRGLDGLDDGFEMAAKYFEQGRNLISTMQELDPANGEFYRSLRNRWKKR